MTGAQLRELRRERGITQKQLADEFGVSESAVNKWENGKSPIPPAVAKNLRLARLSNLTLEIGDLELIHDYANQHGLNFSQAVAELIKRGLRDS